MSGTRKDGLAVDPAEGAGRSETGSRPADPEAMTKSELVRELRQLRAELAARAHMTAIESIDEATASRRLVALEEAIAVMPVGFMLFDANDRLVFKNNRFVLYDSQGIRDRLGTTFEDIVRFGVELGVYPDARTDPEGWIADRLAAHRSPRGNLVQPVRDGRYIQIEEKRLPGGGTVGTYTDVSQIKQAEALRDRAFQEAERASRAKSTFLANMSHELRTPLNAIIGFTQLLLSERGTMIDDERQRDYLHDIEFSAKHLSSIISDLLDISRVEAGQYRLNKQAISIAEVCDQVCRLFDRQALEAGIRLTTAIGEEGAASVRADQRALHQMLINLVSNAIRHARGGDRIDLFSLVRNGAVEIAVRDEGAGIPADELTEVVKPFYRSRRETDQRDSGLGLGLALTKMLMELHGGQLVLESEEGQGTTAILRFPPGSGEDSGESPETDPAVLHQGA